MSDGSKKWHLDRIPVLLGSLSYVPAVVLYYLIFLVFNEIKHGAGDYSVMRSVGFAAQVMAGCLNVWQCRTMCKKEREVTKTVIGKRVASYLFVWTAGSVTIFLLTQSLFFDTFRDSYLGMNFLIGSGVFFMLTYVVLLSKNRSNATN